MGRILFLNRKKALLPGSLTLTHLPPQREANR